MNLADEKQFEVDGTRLTVREEAETWVVIGGRPKRVVGEISEEDIQKFGKNGLMGLAWRYGLRTTAGKAFKLLSHLATQDIDGKWYINLGT